VAKYDTPTDDWITLKAAAERSGYDVKTLRRDRDNGRLKLEDRDGILYVSVAELVAIGRCQPETPAEAGERLTRQRAEARVRELEVDNASLRAQIAHSEALEAALRANIETLESMVRMATTMSGLQAVA
jgi:hypothetical protein